MFTPVEATVFGTENVVLFHHRKQRSNQIKHFSRKPTSYNVFCHFVKENRYRIKCLMYQEFQICHTLFHNTTHGDSRHIDNIQHYPQVLQNSTYKYHSFAVCCSLLKYHESDLHLIHF